MEHRQAPLGNTFINFVSAPPSAMTESGPRHRRRHSFGGFVPHALLLLQQRPFLDILESRGQRRKPPPHADGKQPSDGASLDGLVACAEREKQHLDSCPSGPSASESEPSSWYDASTLYTHSLLVDCFRAAGDGDAAPRTDYESTSTPFVSDLFSQSMPVDLIRAVDDGLAVEGIHCESSSFPLAGTRSSSPRVPSSSNASLRSIKQLRRDCFLELVAAAGGVDGQAPTGTRVASHASREMVIMGLEAKPMQHVTTVMIRNLPRRLAQKTLLEELNNTGFAGLFDFCYIPCCFDSGAGKGYAFVNFTTTEAAERLITAWHKTHRFGLKESDVPLNIAPATVQGLIRNISKWRAPRMSRVRNPNLRPFVVPQHDQLAGESSVSSSGGEQVAPAHTIDAETASQQNKLRCTEL